MVLSVFTFWVTITELFHLLKPTLSPWDSNSSSASSHCLELTLSLSLWFWLPWILHISGIRQSISFYPAGLFSLSSMSSRFIQVVPWIRISFLFKAEQYSIEHIYHVLSVRLLMGNWVVSTFWLLWMAAVMNTGVQVSVWVGFHVFVCVPRNGIAGTCGTSMFKF